MPAKRKTPAKSAKPKPTAKRKPSAKAKPKAQAAEETTPAAADPAGADPAVAGQPPLAAAMEEPPGAPPPPATPPSGRNPLLIPLAIVAALALIAAAVFGYFAFIKKDDPVAVHRTIDYVPKTPAERAAGGSGECGRVTRPEDRTGDRSNQERHSGEDEKVFESTSEPPSSGIHGGGFASNRTIYDEQQPIGNLVHSMDHGSVIIWHQDLPQDEYDLLVATANRNAGKGFGALIMTPYNDMETPIALTAWGVLLECDGVDDEAIDGFIEEFMATGPEGPVACGDMPEGHPRCSE